MHRLKVVVDTNIFISGLIIPHGYPYQLLRLWQDDALDLVSCQELAEKIKEVLLRPKIQKKYATDVSLVNHVLRLIERYSVSAKMGSSDIKVRDAQDQFLLDLAVGAKANYLVSGDDDVLSLAMDKRLGNLKIVPPRYFVEHLKKV